MNSSAAVTKYELLAAQEFKKTVPKKRKFRNKEYTQVYTKEKCLLNEATKTCRHSRGAILTNLITMQLVCVLI